MFLSPFHNAFPLTTTASSLHSSNSYRAQCLLQLDLNRLTVAFAFPRVKQAVFFPGNTAVPNPFQHCFQSFSINILHSCKFLELTLDQKCSSISHINSLKAKCSNTIIILKYSYLSHRMLGSHINSIKLSHALK